MMLTDYSTLSPLRPKLFVIAGHTLTSRFTVLTIGCLLFAITTAHAQTETVNFNSEGDSGPYPASQAAPFSSVDSETVTFSAPSNGSSNPSLLGPINTAFPDNALTASGSAGSSMELNFSASVSSLSLDFQGDAPISAPSESDHFDEARLIGFDGMVEVVSTTVIPDFVNAHPGTTSMTTAAPQNISITHEAGFSRAVFAFFKNGSQANIGTEAIDNVVFTLAPSADEDSMFITIPIADEKAVVIGL